MKTTLFFVGCLICVMTVSTWGQATEPADISGRVVDYKAQPVEKAKIAVFENVYDYTTAEQSTQVLSRTETDAEGRFKTQVFSKYRRYLYIVAKKQWLAMGWSVFNLRYFSTITKENLLIVLEPACRTTGRIIDHEGKAIAGAKILLECGSDYLRRLEQSRLSAPQEWFSTVTNNTGEFQINDLSRDIRVHLMIEAPGRTAVYKTDSSGEIFGYYMGGDKIQFKLPRESAVNGRVLDSKTNQSVEGVLVKISPYRDQPWNYLPQLVLSDRNGKFNFAGVPVEKHFLKVIVPAANKGHWVDKTNVVETRLGTINEFEIKLDKGGYIEVSITCPGSKKIPEPVSVTVSQRGYSSFEGYYKNIRGINEPTRIRAPLGTCTVDIRAGSYSESKKVKVSPGKIVRAKFTIERQCRISGRVVDDSGNGIKGVKVSLYPFGGRVITDNKGAFTIEYQERVRDKFLIVQDMQRNLAAAVKVESDSRPINIKIRPGIKVRGRVTDTKGNPITAARISLFAFLPGSFSSLGSEALTDAQGLYEFLALPLTDGLFEYRYSADASGYGPLRYQKFSITSEPSGICELEKIILEPADESISGIVVDSEGKPAVRVPIFLRGKGQPNRCSTTNEKGEFIVRRICKGPLRIQANYPSFPGGAGYLEARGQDDNVKIILGQERVHVEEKTLMGKQIPNPNDLGIRLNNEEIEEKKLLVCFIDMNQRPSRHLVGELRDQMEELTEQNIVVLLVQASRVDTEKLDQWEQSQKITFPVGIVQNGEDEQLSYWAVKGLPWLILTDDRHVVRAEGFRLSDLNEKN